jgi:anti-sigma B factor antagonist
MTRVPSAGRIERSRHRPYWRRADLRPAGISRHFSFSSEETSMTVLDTAPLARASASAPTLVHLSGDIDIFTTTRLRQRLINALDYSTDLLILNLSRVTFCSADGLGVIIDIQGRAEARGITLALTGVPSRMARLLRITGLDHRFPIMA